MKNYQELFVNEFLKSQNIDDTFAKISNKEGLASGIEYLKKLNCQWLDEDSYTILYTINQFTLKNKTEDMNDLFNKVSNIDDVLNIIKSDKKLIIMLKDYNIEVEIFSKRNPRVVNIIPDIESLERNGTCFLKAYNICLGFKNPSKIVTGYNYGYTDKSKFLHSWVEVTIDGKDYVIDGTLNAMFNKEGYYKLRKIKVLNEITKDELRQDMIKYGKFIEEIGIDVYYVFRDEIIKDLEKNNELFENKKNLI